MTTTLLTGIPRSGTSFVCACLNTRPDCVALVEPMDVPRHGDVPRAVAEVVGYAGAMRARILADRTARSATVDGRITDNTFEEARTDGAMRRPRIQVTDVAIDKPLTPGFRLFIKHPALFTALAQPLLAHLPVVAIVRHPLAALASWQTVDTAIRGGRWPVAEAFAPDLREQLDRIDDPLRRAVALVQWMFRAYRALGPGRVLTYESIVRDPGVALEPLSGTAGPLAHPVKAMDPRSRYVGVDRPALADALLAIEADVEPFYPDFAAGLRAVVRGG